MKRWHALYFALAVLVGVEALVGDRNDAGVLENVRENGVPQRAENAPAPQVAPASQVTAAPQAAALAAWSAGDSDGESDFALDIPDFDPGKTAANGAGASTGTFLPAPAAGAPRLTVAGSLVLPERRNLIES